MTLRFLASLVGLLPFLAGQCAARFVAPDVRDVPVERLIANVERMVSSGPANGHWYYVLGRLHSMAFVKPDATWDARTSIYDETRHERVKVPELPYFSGGSPVPTSSLKFPDRIAQRRAADHLGAAIEAYHKATELIPQDYKVWLGYGWCLEEQGMARDKAVAAYRNAFQIVKASAAVVRSPFAGPTHPNEVAEGVVCREAGEAILRLYGKGVTDITAEEVAEIRRVHALLDESIRKSGLVVTPIVLPVESGPDGSMRSSGVPDDRHVAEFDLSGFGRAPWTWISPDWGFLTWDPRRTGKVASGRQLFGSVTWWIFWKDGYEPLSLLDDDGDGWLRGKELAGLAVWRDRNGNGISDSSEITPVEALGIVGIACRPTGARHGLLSADPGLRYSDGRTGPTVDWISQPMPRIQTTQLIQTPKN